MKRPERLLRKYYREQLSGRKTEEKSSGKQFLLSAAAMFFSCGLLVLTLWTGSLRPSFTAECISDNLRHGEIIDYFSGYLNAFREYGFGGER